MIIEVKIPEIGESITEGVLAVWLQSEGAQVQPGDDLFELETDKVTMNVPAEVGGRLTRLAAEGDVVQVGQAVATVDTDASAQPDAAPAEPAAASEPELPPAPQPEAVPRSPATTPADGPPITPAAGMDQAQAKLAEADGPALSPAVRRLVEQHQLDPGAIAGTGPGGRLTKGDVLAHIDAQAAAPAPAAPPQPAAAPEPAAPPAPAAPASPTALTPAPKKDLVPAADPAGRETRVKMSRLRHRIAERLVAVQHDAAILTTFNEADMSAVMSFRSRHKDKFEKKFDTRLGFMSFFVKAAVDALKTVPQLNARIEGEDIVQQHYYDIGIAVGTDQGLLVPVVRDADSLSFAAIEARIAEYAKKARDRKIGLDDLMGGVFTISNGGIYGSLLSTPILNPPQSGILGLHRIQKRPVVVDDEIVIRPMMYLALSYDHRLVDGGQAVTFLKRIVECIEDPERMLLEV